MEFKEFCATIGFQFLAVSIIIVLKCFCKSIHKGDYTPDNPLQPAWCTIICAVLAVSAIPVYAFLHFTHRYLADFFVQTYRQEQRKVEEQERKISFQSGYSKGYEVGLENGKEIERMRRR